ncbi:MAG TPA: PAS domain S-box protein [Herpetosiphonaceae bacterium]
MTHPTPPDDQDRVSSLRRLGILDTPAEARFDRLTHLAQLVFRVPIVLISLVDANRQWFKSCIGLEVSETGREVSFCAHALLTPDKTFFIPDATKDARFAANPLVTGEPHIRFYAGKPIKSPDGAAVGTLCLIDSQPRAIFSADDERALGELAALVEQELALTSLQEAGAAVKASEARFQRMARTIPGMVYEFVLRPDGSSAFPFVSDGCRAIYGVEPAAVMADGEVIIGMVAPEQRASFEESVAASAASLEPWRWQGRIRNARGEERWVEGNASPEARPDGSVYWAGVLLDVTDRQLAQQDHARFAALADTTPDFVGIATMDGAPIYLNPAGRAMMGIASDEELARLRVPDSAPPWARAKMMEESIPAAVRDGRWSGELAILGPGGREIPVSQVILCHRDERGQPMYLSTVARDLSDQKAAEARQHALQEEIIQMQANAIAELSTPLIPITGQLVVMPLVGALDSQRAQQVLDVLLHGVAEQRAQVVLLDITGVPVVDTQVASVLISAARAVQLLGAEVVITGIKPEIAQTLVGLGVQLGGIATEATLQTAVQRELARRRHR